jgi:hypothetical protein
MSAADDSHISKEACFLSGAFHEIAYRLWESKYDADQLRKIIPNDLLYSIKEIALTIDSQTDFALSLGLWLTSTFFDSFRTPDLFTKRPE